ncbi:MAG: CHAP domain-containing protein [Gammaproteobacteria bacterium]|nr:MAG: CHAP domain-containing protein [Gammaproteobacteria bacterium]
MSRQKARRTRKTRWLLVAGLAVLLLAGGGYYVKSTLDQKMAGQVIDRFNGVAVFYNGKTGNVSGRNVTADGYNLGLKFQCVEFVKRYYHRALNHKMPDSYGHAKDFFNPRLKDGERNTQRDLIQYTNPSRSKPQVNDLVVYSGTLGNRYGHVAIISAVSDNQIEVVQQNVGLKTRDSFALKREQGRWRIDNSRILGWLRKDY